MELVAHLGLLAPTAAPGPVVCFAASLRGLTPRGAAAVGHHLTRHLLRAGYAAVAVDLPSGFRVAYHTMLFHAWQNLARRATHARPCG